MSGKTHSELRRQHLDYVRRLAPDHQKRLHYSRQEITNAATQSLRDLLKQARENSPWHRERLQAIDIANITLDQISQIPILTKGEIQENWNQIVTDRSLTQVRVSDFLHNLKEPAYLMDRYLALASGGSSGKRGVYVWDWETFAQIASTEFRYQVRDDHKEGRTGKKRLKAVIAAGKPSHGSGPLFTANVDPAEEVKLYSVLKPFKDICQEILRDQPDQLIGYSSVIARLAEETLAGRLDISPNRVSTNSEPLLPEYRKLFQNAWGAIINNTWGCTETGMAAIECDQQAGMHLIEDLMIVEPVDEENRPVPDGQLSEKVIITNLFNHTFPFIRYELTDRIRVLDKACPCGSQYRLIADIQGRMDDEFHYPGGIRIHPILFRSPLGQNHHIFEYQVQQTDGGAHILLVGDASDYSAVMEKIRESLGQQGFKKPKLSYEIVSEVPRHRETGKMKRFIPLKD